MIGKDEIAEACRNNDAISEEHRDLLRSFVPHQIDPDGLAHVAEQRALRVIMLARGQNPNVSQPLHVMLTREETVQLVSLAAIFIDGFAAAMTVKERHGG